MEKNIKRKIGLGFLVIIFSTTQLSAWVDWFGSNAKKKLAFSNQVIEQILTPEEIKTKERTEELIRGDGNNVIICDLLSGRSLNSREQLGYCLDLNFKKYDQEALRRHCRVSSRKMIAYDFKQGSQVLEKVNYQVVSEKPKDIIYVAEGLPEDPKSDFGFFYIAREVLVEKWGLGIRFECARSKMTSEKKAEWIERMKNIQILNDWTAQNQ
jgi:hypothetical protein